MYTQNKTCKEINKIQLEILALKLMKSNPYINAKICKYYN